MTDAKVNTLEEFLDLEKTKETMAQVQEILESDAETVALIEKAETEEGVWEVFKKYVSMPVEYFKKLFQRVTDYFKSGKAALSDETLENVVGGWSFGEFWNKYKKTIITAVVAVGAAALICSGLGAPIGAAIGGAAAAYGAGVGACVGWCVGAVGAGALLIKTGGKV